ncbi:unnamed protein product [Menidia menidia]|uniref:(Atlantic silverside) hypothetical protein n=1 Tax=Menidia menidia TaxID=238744 RepID=A0A8S4BW38_9TELE|nr:unnamed protein product [Menidia menidia]
MSDDSSSEEEWCLPTGKVSETKCWECGKPFGNLRNLMKHYKSHNINATCHICKVTFRRLTSLNTHLDNVHSPPFCLVCYQSFSNVLELNKHAESHCKNSVLFESNSSLKNRRQKNGSFSKEVSPQQSTASFHHDSASDLKLHEGIGMELERPGRSVSSMDYVLSEDDDDMETESSSSSSSEGTASNLSSTDTSDSSSTSDSEDSPTTHPSINSEMCEKCVVVQQAINGKLLVDQNSVASQPFIVNSSSPSGSEIPPTPTTSVSSSTSVKQPSSHPSERSSASPAASDPGASAPTILALFENISPYVALMKRLNTKWRSKAPCPCRQCGAILRQPSLIISHRYRHRGHRPHRCQCGRAFKHRLHLLRHCMQHAEATSYICVGCGDTFTGAEVLAQHLKGMSRKRSRSGRIIKTNDKERVILHSGHVPLSAPLAVSIVHLISGLRWRRTSDSSSDVCWKQRLSSSSFCSMDRIRCSSSRYTCKIHKPTPGEGIDSHSDGFQKAPLVSPVLAAVALCQIAQKDARTLAQINKSCKQSAKMHLETGCSHQEKGNGCILQKCSYCGKFGEELWSRSQNTRGTPPWAQITQSDGLQTKLSAPKLSCTPGVAAVLTTEPVRRIAGTAKQPAEDRADISVAHTEENAAKQRMKTTPEEALSSTLLCSRMALCTKYRRRNISIDSSSSMSNRAFPCTSVFASTMTGAKVETSSPSIWVARFPGSDSGTETSAESPQFRLVRPSQLAQSALESARWLWLVISISRAHTSRPPSPLSLSRSSAAPSSACPLFPVMSSQTGEGIVR